MCCERGTSPGKILSIQNRRITAYIYKVCVARFAGGFCLLALIRMPEVAFGLPELPGAGAIIGIGRAQSDVPGTGRREYDHAGPVTWHPRAWLPINGSARSRVVAAPRSAAIRCLSATQHQGGGRK